MKNLRISEILQVRISSFLILICSISSLIFKYAKADVIMMNGNSMPSIIEDDEIGPDVILMPGMGGMIMNDDLVL